MRTQVSSPNLRLKTAPPDMWVGEGLGEESPAGLTCSLKGASMAWLHDQQMLSVHRKRT
jgi:hypothetical protein